MRIAAGLGCCGMLLLAACSGDFQGQAPPMMGANELQPENGLFTGPTGEAVIAGGNFDEQVEGGGLEPADRPSGSPYRYTN